MTALARPILGALQSMPPLVLAALLATWLIWGSTYLAIKWALASFPPFWQMGTRFIVAGLLLGAWALGRGARWPARDEWINAGLLGALMLGVSYGLTAQAELSVSSGLVVAFIGIGPALQAAMELPYGLRPTRREAAGIALGLAGVLWLALGQGFSAAPQGLLAVLVSSIAWKLGSVWTNHGLPRTLGGRALHLAPGAMGYASQMLAGGGVLVLLSLLLGEQPVWPLQPRAFWAWLYLVVAGSIVGFSAFMLLLQRTPTAVSASYAYVNPVIGMVLGATLGGEVITRGEWMAAALITLSVVLMVGGRR
ncbi:MAG: permease [Rubrivivax sp. SCN 71-131]|jgi:drug/metabolite transporter (DMT)-like permease|nr:MAG: permease [Rubrivivax sp. SCN 71-131]